MPYSSPKSASPPPPLNFYDEQVHFQREVKYLGVILDSTLTWKKHIDNTIHKFFKARNDIAHLLYSNNMNLGNKILLYKTVLRPILLYCSQIWGAAANTNIQKVQTAQNKTLRMITHAPWYKRNNVIHHELNIHPIRKIIKNQSQKFYHNMYTIPNPEIFNLPDYDEREFHRRPRATQSIITSIHYKNP